MIVPVCLTTELGLIPRGAWFGSELLLLEEAVGALVDLELKEVQVRIELLC